MVRSRSLSLFLVLPLLLITSCYSTKDMSKFELDKKEKREWPSFESESLNLGIQYPKDLVAKDSEDLIATMHIYHPDGNGKFNALIKEFDAPADKDLREIGFGIVEGARFNFNYSRKKSGIVEYDGQEAFEHEYTTADVFGNTKRFYQLVYPFNGKQFLATLETRPGDIYGDKKKFYKILRSQKAL